MISRTFQTLETEEMRINYKVDWEGAVWYKRKTNSQWETGTQGKIYFMEEEAWSTISNASQENEIEELAIRV